jgi:hypothetical protein
MAFGIYRFTAMKPTLHNILFLRMPVALVICLLVFVVTLFFVPFSMIYLCFALGVGIIDAIIEIDELTGGKMLIYFSLPIIFGYCRNMSAMSKLS